MGRIFGCGKEKRYSPIKKPKEQVLGNKHTQSPSSSLKTHWQQLKPGAKGAIITGVVIASLAILMGSAYALTGHFVGFGAVDGAIKNFYTHLNIWKGIAGLGVPALLLSSLVTYAIARNCWPQAKSSISTETIYEGY